MRARFSEQGICCRAYLLPAAFLGEDLSTFRQTCTGHDSITRALKIQDTNPLGVTTNLAEFIHLAPKHFALSSHQHDLITVSDLKKPDSKPIPFSRLHADDAFPSAPLGPILVHWRAVSVTAFRDREGLGSRVGSDGFHADDFVAF